MRKLLIASTSLLLAACATAPQKSPAGSGVPVTTVHQGATLIGLSASDLVARFGQPAFRLKEGPGTKLQWRSTRCVLDAYLYPRSSNRGDEYVTHVDSRRPNGENSDLGTCVGLLAR